MTFVRQCLRRGWTWGHCCFDRQDPLECSVLFVLLDVDSRGLFLFLSFRVSTEDTSESEDGVFRKILPTMEIDRLTGCVSRISMTDRRKVSFQPVGSFPWRLRSSVSSNARASSDVLLDFLSPIKSTYQRNTERGVSRMEMNAASGWMTDR